jgi:hypothetical protein
LISDLEGRNFSGSPGSETRLVEVPMATFKVGDRITQPNYGDGTITGADDHHIVIDFDGHGVKRFATTLVVLERTSAPAPARAAKAKRAAKTGVKAAAKTTKA